MKRSALKLAVLMEIYSTDTFLHVNQPTDLAKRQLWGKGDVFMRTTKEEWRHHLREHMQSSGRAPRVCWGDPACVHLDTRHTAGCQHFTCSFLRY